MLLHCGKFHLDLSRPKVMGIVNVTPDSFSDGGRHLSHAAAIAHAHRLIVEGADMLDIGGESTRPGAAAVGEQEELERVLPVIEGLRDIAVPISIDTWKPAVMRAALAAGASMVNDINALQAPDALEAVAESDAAVCLMHKQGNPENMQLAPRYADVMDEVMSFLRLRVQAVQAAGIARERIAIDPGFGFGKTLEHNLALLKNLRDFAALGVPVLAGLSRKSMLGAITGQDVDHRQTASVAAALIAVQRGAAIVRVHDVRETVDALKVWDAVNSENHISHG
ncbi:MAG: dihydropteroate synthase [Gallionellaceae bacterium]|nr:MAG: dihydropteroate synthase [Gallionellaceae bacterium]